MRRIRAWKWFPARALLCSGLLLLFLPVNTTAQEKKREIFGSSLKRLKWDKKKGAAVDKKSEKETAKDQSTSTEDTAIVRIQTSMAVFDLLVIDRQGDPISGLTKEDFIVSEDGVLQQVNTFALGDDASLPRSIVLILDYSLSQKPFLQTSVAAAKTLVEHLRPKDRMAIVTDDVSLLLNFTDDKSQLKAALDSLQKKALVSGAPGRSKQFSALFAVLRELLDGEEQSIIIFQTDGDELTYLQPQAANLRYVAAGFAVNFSVADIIAAARRKRVRVYSIISGGRLIGFSSTVQGERARQSQEALATIAAQSGGWHDFLEWPEQAATIYERILTDINRRYIISYYPTNEVRDGALRRMHFEIRGHPEYLIVGRRFYYAPTQ